MGRRNALWLASVTPPLTAFGFLFTDQLAAWFVLLLLGAMAGGMRWVLAEAFIAEFAPPQHRGLLIGAYATMIGMTMVVGPALLAWLGADDPAALSAMPEGLLADLTAQEVADLLAYLSAP